MYDVTEEFLWKRLEELAKQVGRTNDLELLREQRLIELNLLLPAGLVRRLREEAWALGYGVSDYLALLLSRRYRNWLPPAARRAWRRRVERRRRR